MLFKLCIIFIILITVISSKPVRQDENNGNDDDDYEHEEGENDDSPVINEKAPPTDGAPECHKHIEEQSQQRDVDLVDQISPKDKKFSERSANLRDKEERLSQTKRRTSEELPIRKTQKQNVADKLAEIEGEDELNVRSDDFSLDYSDAERQYNEKYSIDPSERRENFGKKKNKHWFDFYRDRRHVKEINSQTSKVNEKENNKGPEDEVAAIKRHIKKLTTEELELLLKSLSDDKRVLLQKIVDSDENLNKREITKRAGTVEENNMMIHSDVQQSQSDEENSHRITIQNGLATTLSAKPVATRSAKLDSKNEELDSSGEGGASEYDASDNSMLESLKIDSKRDVREDYATDIDTQNDDPDDDLAEKLKSTNDQIRQTRHERLYKRTADSFQDDLTDSVTSLDDSFSGNLNSDLEMSPLVRIKRNKNNGHNPTEYDESKEHQAKGEAGNEINNNESNASDNLTSPVELKASFVSVDGENILDSLEAGESDVVTPTIDETSEIKNWNLLNCSCENIVNYPEIANQVPEKKANTEAVTRRSAQSDFLRFSLRPPTASDFKNKRPISTDLKIIDNSASGKESMYNEVEMSSMPKMKGLQRYKRIRRVKPAQDSSN